MDLICYGGTLFPKLWELNNVVLKKLITEKGNNCQHFLLSSAYQSPALCYYRKTKFHIGSAKENDAIKISDTVAESIVLWNASVTCLNITWCCQTNLSSLASSVTCEINSLKKQWPALPPGWTAEPYRGSVGHHLPLSRSWTRWKCRPWSVLPTCGDLCTYRAHHLHTHEY